MSHEGLVGRIANDEWRWRRRHDDDLNCLRDADRQLVQLLDELIAKAVALMTQPDGKEKVQAAVKEGGLRADLAKRGAIRSVFDSRSRFSRCFSPKQHNRPTSLEALFELNDVELYDLDQDPHETMNLALDRREHGELLLTLNDRLNRLIDEEVGEDICQMLPGGVDGGWVATDAVKGV